MNRATRDKFATRTDQTALDGGNACWETAPKVFAKLNEDFGPFDLDLTANTSNHLAPWFGPGSPLSMEIDGADRACTDCLIVPWHRFGHNGYSNPPYGPFVAKVLSKAVAEANAGFRSTFLLPLRVTAAFRAFVLHGASDLLLCTSRLVFFENGLPRCSYDKQGRPHADTAMFDSMIVRYAPQARKRDVCPRLAEWDVPIHVTRAHVEQWAALHPYRPKAVGE
jgi:hypothetical protein